MKLSPSHWMLQRLPAVRDRLVADVFSRAVVDLRGRADLMILSTATSRLPG